MLNGRPRLPIKVAHVMYDPQLAPLGQLGGWAHRACEDQTVSVLSVNVAWSQTLLGKMFELMPECR